MSIIQATLSNFDTLPDTGYMRQAQLIPDVVPFSSATLWRKCKSGDFPKPVKLSERVTAWRVGDIRKFLDDQAKGLAS
ncbi:MAG: AlpA family phage regulatory protein [Comamonadaceae bacterium]|nr:MAG: AlpA family phage regulatory protein [Comamonadaceae bacterium]